MTTDNLRTGFDNQKVEAAIYAYLDKRARKPEAPASLGDDRNRAQIPTQRRNSSFAGLIGTRLFSSSGCQWAASLCSRTFAHGLAPYPPFASRRDGLNRVVRDDTEAR